MSIRRIGVLLSKELRQGASNFFFLYAIAAPLVISLVITLVFGDLFSETPRLGLVDHGDSELITLLEDETSIQTTIYTSETALREAVARGNEEIGLILPAGFDEAVDGSAETQVTTYRWGESSGRNLLVIESAISRAFVQMAGVEMPVTVESAQLGDADTATWTERLLPLIVLMTVILGGTMVPAASLVEEKQKRTLIGLTTTPVTLPEVYVSKTLLGMTTGLVMGVAILVVNQAFGNQPLLLVGVLTLSALASAVFGVLLGSLVKDINVLLAVLKAAGLVLFAPGILELFPEAPEWIAQIFPTYYVLNPVLEVSQQGAALGEIAGDLAILSTMVAVLLLILAFLIERQAEELALAS